MKFWSLFLIFSLCAGCGSKEEKKENEDEEQVEEEEESEELEDFEYDAGLLYSLPEPVVVNIEYPGRITVVTVNCSFEMSNKKVLKEIDIIRPRIIHHMILVIGHTDIEEIRTYEGKEELARTLRRELNRLLTKGDIQQVLFKNFVVT